MTPTQNAKNGLGGSGSAVNVSVIAGEDLLKNDYVYVELNADSGTAGRAYKADADFIAKSTSSFYCGFVAANTSAGATASICVSGVQAGFTSLTPGALQYISQTAGLITETAPTNAVIVGIALAGGTEILLNNRGVVTSAVRDGGVAGYVAGGYSGAPVATADVITFSTDATAAVTTANLSQARYAAAGISSGTTKGYFLGGDTGASNLVVTADLLTYSTNVTAASTSTNLANVKDYQAGLSDKSASGYSIGGFTGALVNTAEKITFATNALAAATTANITSNRAYLAGLMGNTTKGYVGGGDTNVGNSPVVTTDKCTYATSATAAATTANMSQARNGYAAAGDGSTKGYFAGGYTPTDIVVATTDKVTFSSDTTAAATTANLSQARYGLSGFGAGSSKGYFLGGNSGAKVATADKVTFSTDVTAAATTADLSQARWWVAGMSDCAY